MSCVFCGSPYVVLVNNHSLYECADCGGMFVDYDHMPDMDDTQCPHSFIDTGFVRSWCKYCDIEGVFNMELGGYTTYENDARILSRNSEKEPE